MHISGLLALVTLQIDFPQDTTTNVLMGLRWVHFVAGITWLGLLYFFNLVSVPFLQELDPATKGKVVPALMPRALWWFRWASVVTVLAGIAYWMIIVSSDAHNAKASGGTAIWSFFLVWTLAFAVQMGALMAPADVLHKGPVLGVIVGVAVFAAAYAYLAINSHGWESNRLLSIGIGGGIGWFMMLTVWGIVWRAQKKLIRWTRENAESGTPIPPQAAHLARLAFLASRVNAWLSLVLLFFMGAASHYPLFGNLPTP